MKNSIHFLLFILILSSLLSLQGCVVSARPAAVVVNPAAPVVYAPIRPVRKKVLMVRPYRPYRHRTIIIR